MQQVTEETAGPDKAKETYKEVVRELRGGRYIDQSVDTQFSDAWIILAVLLTLLGIGFDNRFLTGSALMLLVIAGVSSLWNKLSLFGLHYHRHFSENRAFLGETIKVTLEVRNQKFIPLPWLQIVDTFPSDLPVIGEEMVMNEGNNVNELRTFWTPGPFQRMTRHFTIHCTRRGFHAYGPATISTGDGFGLFDRKVQPPEQERIIVYPKLYSVAELGLPAKNPFGESSARQRLFEDPLRTLGIREWDASDNMNRVHWKATARHQELLSRVYEPSQDPHMLIVLNVATMARYWQGIMPELHERAISVAGSLAALCVEQRMPVGLVANGVLPGSDQPLRLLPGRNADQLVRILELLAAIQPLASKQIEQMILAESPRLPWGSTLIVVSAVVTEELMAALLELDGAGRQIVLFTLAAAPPDPLDYPSRIKIYHLAHLVNDLISPVEVKA